MCAIEWPALWLCKWGPEPPDAFSRRFPVIRINQLSRLCLSFFFFHFISLFYSIFFPHTHHSLTRAHAPISWHPEPHLHIQSSPGCSRGCSGMLGDARGCSGMLGDARALRQPRLMPCISRLDGHGTPRSQWSSFAYSECRGFLFGFLAGVESESWIHPLIDTGEATSGQDDGQ